MRGVEHARDESVNTHSRLVNNRQEAHIFLLVPENGIRIEIWEIRYGFAHSISANA